jgi:hypothetical protein
MAADATPAPVVAMIFEFWFDPEAPHIFEEYLANKFVAIGFFENEAAVKRWRTAPEHRHVQLLGRNRLFTRYRLRMADVTRDYGTDDRRQAPRDSRAWHETDGAN